MKVPVGMHLGCEKHMKGPADELFGWMAMALKWTTQIKCNITSLHELKEWFDKYTAGLRRRDPSSPYLIICTPCMRMKQSRFTFLMSLHQPHGSIRARFKHTLNEDPADEDLMYPEHLRFRGDSVSRIMNTYCKSKSKCKGMQRDTL